MSCATAVVYFTRRGWWKDREENEGEGVVL